MDADLKINKSSSAEPFLLRKVEEPEVKETRILEQIKNVCSEITVEPVFILKAAASVLVYQAYQDLLLLKSCKINLQYSDEVCETLMQKNYTNLSAEKDEIHKFTAHTVAWSSIIEPILPIMYVLFAGSWSDKYGRKGCILFSMFGFFMQAVFLLGNVVLTTWPAEVAAVSFFAPLSVTGSFLLLNLSLYSYLADITSLSARTYRIGFGSTAGRVGSFFTLLLFASIYSFVGLAGIFSIAAFFYGASFLYIWWRVREKPKEGNKSVCGALCNVRHIWHSFSSVFKRREGNKRKYLLLILMVCFLQKGQAAGEWAILYLYTSHSFKWKSESHLYFLTIKEIVILLGALLCFVVLAKFCKVRDEILGALGAGSRILAAFTYGSSHWPWLMYVGATLDIMHAGMFPLTRSLVSKMVPFDEIGKVSAIHNVIEALVRIIFRPIYSWVFAATISTYPGTCFFMSVGMSVISGLIFLYMYFSMKQSRKEDTCTNELTNLRSSVNLT